MRPFNQRWVEDPRHWANTPIIFLHQSHREKDRNAKLIIQMHGQSTFITDPRTSRKWSLLRSKTNILSFSLRMVKMTIQSKWVALLLRWESEKDSSSLLVFFRSLVLVSWRSVRTTEKTTSAFNPPRSHDGCVELPSGVLEPETGSSPYASQQKVFDDLGRDVLKNAFDGKIRELILHEWSSLSLLIRF